MKNLTLATLYRQSSQTSNPNLEANFAAAPALLFDGHPIDFLLDIIQKQCSFKVLSPQVWALRYFIGSPYEQTLFVSFAAAPATHPDLLTHLPQQTQAHVNEFINQPRKMVNAVFIQTSQYEPTNQVIQHASHLVRGTSSLTFDPLTRHSDRFIHVDGRGSVLLSPNSEHMQTFYMQVILLSMAKAYLLATSAIVSELGECCEEFTKLKCLYRQAIIFNAKSYFACPVKVNRYDAYTLWQDIRSTMPIDDINNEIVQQVESIHRLLASEEDALEHQTEIKISKRLGWMGVGIGGLSLASLFEITPPKVMEFFGSWWHVLF